LPSKEVLVAGGADVTVILGNKCNMPSTSQPEMNIGTTINTKLKLATSLLFLATLNLQPSALFAQGSLTPPGAPGPTFKTLG